MSERLVPRHRARAHADVKLAGPEGGRDPGQVIKPNFTPDFAHIRGLETAKRTVEIAVVGDHSLLIVGPPGQGKDMLLNAGRELRKACGLKTVPVWDGAMEIGQDGSPRNIYWASARELPDKEDARMFDLVLRIAELSYADWHLPAACPDTLAIAEQVGQARARLHTYKFEMHVEAKGLLEHAWNRLKLSPRSAAKVENVARTLRAMDDIWSTAEPETMTIGRLHIAEALSYLCQG